MIKFRIERGWSFDGHQLWVLEYRNGKSFVAKPIQLEFIPLQETLLLPDPTLKIDGILGREIIIEMKKALAGYTFLDDKEDYETAKRVEKAMQAHIDSLKLVVDRALPRG